jgi:hypothetical protein
MAYKALTVIRHGKDDGSRVEFQPGEDVTGLPKETMQDLLEAGAIAKYEDWERLNAPVRETGEVENELRGQLVDQQKEIEKLKAALAKAETGKTSSPSTK